MLILNLAIKILWLITCSSYSSPLIVSSAALLSLLLFFACQMTSRIKSFGRCLKSCESLRSRCWIRELRGGWNHWASLQIIICRCLKIRILGFDLCGIILHPFDILIAYHEKLLINCLTTIEIWEMLRMKLILKDLLRKIEWSILLNRGEDRCYSILLMNLDPLTNI